MIEAVGGVGRLIGLIVAVTICLCVLMIVGTACYQVTRKTRGKPLTLPPPPKATADDVRHYPERDEDDE